MPSTQVKTIDGAVHNITKSFDTVKRYIEDARGQGFIRLSTTDGKVLLNMAHIVAVGEESGGVAVADEG